MGCGMDKHGIEQLARNLCPTFAAQRLETLRAAPPVDPERVDDLAQWMDRHAIDKADAEAICVRALELREQAVAEKAKEIEAEATWGLELALQWVALRSVRAVAELNAPGPGQAFADTFGHYSAGLVRASLWLELHNLPQPDVYPTVALQAALRRGLLSARGYGIDGASRIIEPHEWGGGLAPGGWEIKWDGQFNPTVEEDLRHGLGRRFSRVTFQRAEVWDAFPPRCGEAIAIPPQLPPSPPAAAPDKATALPANLDEAIREAARRVEAYPGMNAEVRNKKIQDVFAENGEPRPSPAKIRAALMDTPYIKQRTARRKAR